jgi:hypothetical protein
MRYDICECNRRILFINVEGNTEEMNHFSYIGNLRFLYHGNYAHQQSKY